MVTILFARTRVIIDIWPNHDDSDRFLIVFAGNRPFTSASLPVDAFPGSAYSRVFHLSGSDIRIVLREWQIMDRPGAIPGWATTDRRVIWKRRCLSYLASETNTASMNSKSERKMSDKNQRRGVRTSVRNHHELVNKNRASSSEYRKSLNSMEKMIIQLFRMGFSRLKITEALHVGQSREGATFESVPDSFWYGMILRIEMRKPYTVWWDIMKSIANSHPNADSLLTRGLKLVSLHQCCRVAETVRRRISSRYHRLSLTSCRLSINLDFPLSALSWSRDVAWSLRKLKTLHLFSQ
jgi:hypothetical protein